MKKRLAFTGLLLLGILLFAVTLKNTGLDRVIDTIQTFPPYGFVIFLSITFTYFLIFTWRWQLILKTLGHSVPFRKLFWFRLVGFAVSYITPAAQIGGEPFRILLLKQEHVPLKDGLSSVFIDKTMEILLNIFFITIGIFIAFSLGLHLMVKGIAAMIIIFITGFTLIILAIIYKWRVFSGTILLFRLNKFAIFQKNLKKIQIVEDKIYNTFHQHPQTMVKCALLTFAIYFFFTLEQYIILYLLGVSLNLSQIFIIVFIPFLAFLIPTPAALGTLEGVVAILFNFLGIPISAIGFILILRFRDIICTTFGLTYAAHRGISIMNPPIPKISGALRQKFKIQLIGC